MKYIIPFLGLASLAGLFLGTAVAILFFGFMIGLKVFVASMLIFMFCIFLEVSK